MALTRVPLMLLLQLLLDDMNRSPENLSRFFRSQLEHKLFLMLILSTGCCFFHSSSSRHGNKLIL